MKILVLLLVTLALPLSSIAAVNCTQEDQSKWIDQAKFQADRKSEGYEIKVFKVTKGNCYEIYGKNKEGKKVEIYFNPLTAEIVKSKVK